MTKPLFESSIKSLPFLHRGKVRDLYAVGDDKLLVIQSDRLSAFDVILPDPIPGKGEVLTALSFFWFDTLKHVVPNHLTKIEAESVVAADEREQVAGRAMVVKKYKPLLIEAVVRGYIIGSGWKDYQQTGAVCGIKLPPGLTQAQKLPQPIFTPASKAPMGEHDENITFDDAVKAVGSRALAERVRSSDGEGILSPALELYALWREISVREDDAIKGALGDMREVPVWRVPDLADDVHDLASLRRVGEELLGPLPARSARAPKETT
jgi:hypothetical protein